ncbi:hypothetical protein COY17_04195 [Candidatus Saccharibacteria bacterium CG_4_10_14_0_2_um_filter_52_9]|nr:MAG: hypothetical protein COY17_04195 [Candidatus Saccharibacteria bacterium CG_4_10_14_0_2_um_filter_52_9]
MIIYPNRIELMAANQCARNLEADETLVNAIQLGSEILGTSPVFGKVEGPVELNHENAAAAVMALSGLVRFETNALGGPASWRAKTADHYLGILKDFVAFDASQAPQISLAA